MMEVFVCRAKWNMYYLVDGACGNPSGNGCKCERQDHDLNMVGFCPNDFKRWAGLGRNIPRGTFRRMCWTPPLTSARRILADRKGGRIPKRAGGRRANS